MGDTERRARAHFDADAWEEDLARATPAGRQAAEAARKDYEQHDVPITQLRRVAEHGHDRTVLPDCTKVYVPAPAGRFGMIFVLKFQPDGRPCSSPSACATTPKARSARLSTNSPTSACTDSYQGAELEHGHHPRPLAVGT